MLHRRLSASHCSLGTHLSENEHITHSIIGTLLIVTEGINWTGCWHCMCKQACPRQSGGYSHPTPKPWPHTLPDLGQVVTSSLSWWTPCTFTLSRHIQHEKAEAWGADQKPPAWPRQSNQLILLDPALQLRACLSLGLPLVIKIFLMSPLQNLTPRQDLRLARENTKHWSLPASYSLSWFFSHQHLGQKSMRLCPLPSTRHQQDL